VFGASRSPARELTGRRARPRLASDAIAPNDHRSRSISGECRRLTTLLMSYPSVVFGRSGSLDVGQHGAVSTADRPYATAAAHYLRGRPPYSRELPAVMRAELGLDGSGVLIDVGCRPGSLAVQLAVLFHDVIGIDPEPAMLKEARRHGTEHDVDARWIQARAEDLATLDLPTPRLVTFGQSLHWTDQRTVLAMVYELLGPGGAVALISPDATHGTPPTPPPAPPIPHDQIEAIIGRYTGWSRGPRQDSFERSLQESPFGESHVMHAPGRPDIIRSSDGVVSGYLSMSFAAPDRFGDRVDDFVAELAALLDDASPTGQFHDWPGDTAVVWAVKPG
jgi:precorrin-6B methylase 2